MQKKTDSTSSPQAGTTISSRKLNYFSANSISLRTQKKLAGQFPLHMTKFFIDETSSRLFENVNQLLVLQIGCAQKANKLMKQIVKMNVKLAILNYNAVFDNRESIIASELKDTFHNTAECFLRIRKSHRNRLGGVNGSIENMIAQVDQASRLIIDLTQRHLSKKTQTKIIESFAFFGNKDFLESVLDKSKEEYSKLIDAINEDLEELIDRGML
ncbi:Tumor necrosis factor alpha-induced protein 8-like 2 [Cichlidogyrus casuarinus]|uniref:Tumor necrosis factor alpha-induced protein 8-like 2 n=1 Tax=Cichlidogyrus casuarinus TaxID=1844966 RepID=A0ABD2QN47_9PLAT